MTNLVLMPAAIADIEDIWTYTEQRWGTAQAERYVAMVGEACHGLARATTFSQDASHVRAGYRRAHVGSHIVFFRTDPAGRIVVVRVLHRSMDADRHL